MAGRRAGKMKDWLALIPSESCVVGRNDMIIVDHYGGGQCRMDRADKKVRRCSSFFFNVLFTDI